MLIVRPLCLHEPVQHALPDTDEASQVPCKGLLHVLGVSDCARPCPRKPFDVSRCCLLFNGTRSAPRNLTRFAAQYPARGLPCERFTAALADRTSCITRGRGGWLGLTPWKTRTSYPLPAFLAHSEVGQSLETHSPLASHKVRNGLKQVSTGTG